MQEQTGPYEFNGRVVRANAYDEDLMAVMNEQGVLVAVPAKPVFKVIDGGKV